MTSIVCKRFVFHGLHSVGILLKGRRGQSFLENTPTKMINPIDSITVNPTSFTVEINIYLRDKDSRHTTKTCKKFVSDILQ